MWIIKCLFSLFSLHCFISSFFHHLCRSFAKPPKAVQDICECIVIVKGIKDVSWKSARGMMSEANFLRQLTEMDVDSITSAQQKQVKGKQGRCLSFPPLHLFSHSLCLSIPFPHFLLSFWTIISLFLTSSLFIVFIFSLFFLFCLLSLLLLPPLLSISQSLLRLWNQSKKITCKFICDKKRNIQIHGGSLVSSIKFAFHN